MSETQAFTVIILLATCAGCLVLLLAAELRNGWCLQRIEQQLKVRGVPAKSPAAAPEAADSGSRGEFEAFLAEDPARRQLAKNDQSSAYRRWRRDRGLNWSKP